MKRHRIADCSWIYTAALCALMAVMAIPALAQSTARPNRIQAALNSGALASMAQSVPPQARLATDVGLVDPEMEMGSLTMNFGVSAEQRSELNALLAAQHDPSSPQYHQWITQEQYGTRFGMTDADLQTVTSWLESQGFTVNGVSASRNAIYFSGRAWQVEAAFHTQLHIYQWQGENHFANSSDLELPAALTGVVLNIRGLNDFRLKPHGTRPLAPAFTVSNTVHYLSPADWGTIYNVNALYDIGFTGAGSYVGVVGQTYVPQGDIDNFRSAAGLGSTHLITQCISTAALCSTISSGDLFEADLDVEWAGGIAKDATVVYVFAGGNDTSQGVLDALQYAVQTYKVPATGKAVPVVSMSYGDCELDSSLSYRNYIDSIGTQANVQGQTLVVSSGDDGAACGLDTGYPAHLGEYVDIPADSPYFTGVGGTTLDGDQASPSTYWIQTPSLVDSAKMYIPETSWNDTLARGNLAASGGGVSLYYPQPDGTAVTGGFTQPTPGNYSGAAGRFVPDISFAASPDHNGYLMCSQDNNSTTTGTDCASGFLSSKGYLDVVGGTSAGTPAFAGMLTLLEQRFGTQGNFNIQLYGLAADSSTYASVFHDITTGDNIVPCVVKASDPGCDPGTATMGYEATTGYDMVTGLGTIDAGALYAAMGPPLDATTTSVSASPNPVVLNASTTLTATVTSGAAGTITGTVTFSVGGKTLGSAALPSGTATLSNVAVTTANGFAAGNNTVQASYAYNSTNFAPSSGSVVVNVLTSKAATSTGLSASTSPVMLNSGTETLTATVSSGTAGTITGTVTFTVNSKTLGTATLSGGVATLSNVAVSAANGFTGGTDTVAATYGGDSVFAASSGSTQITVQAFSVSMPSSVTLSAGSSTQVTLNLTSSYFAGTVNFNATSSTNSAAVTGSTPAPVTLTSNGSGSTTLTITAAPVAANRSPALPWKGGGAVAFALMLGAPFTLHRKKLRRRVLTALLMMLALSLGGMLLSCSGGSTSAGPATATLTVNPQSNATASPLTIKVYVK